MQLRELFEDLPDNSGSVVPLAMQQLLRSELDVEQDWSDAEALLLNAIQSLPQHMELKIALFKLYAYSNRFEESLALIDGVLEQSLLALGESLGWQELPLAPQRWNNARGTRRQFLYSLKARGFVLLKMGQADEALSVLQTLVALDHQDQVGGSVVLDMALAITEAEECDL